MNVINKGNRKQVIDAMKDMEDDDKYLSYAPIVWDGLSSAQREQLVQLLFTGPVYDGSVISKSARDELIEYGLATRCCFMGEDGYTAATYPALTVFKSSKAESITAKPGVRG